MPGAPWPARLVFLVSSRPARDSEKYKVGSVRRIMPGVIFWPPHVYIPSHAHTETPNTHINRGKGTVELQAL